MGLLSHTSFSEKACAILYDGHILHTLYDGKLFALETIAHGLYDEFFVIQIIAYD
jgi:hypothetical protein